MKPRRITLITLVVCLSMLVTLLPGSVMPATAQGPQPPAPPSPQPPLPPEDAPWRVTPGGRRYMPAGAQRHAPAAALAPQTTGGPDDYGYTWDDSVPLGWIDAVAGGTDTGMSGDSWDLATGPIALPFTFKYYENSYTGVYVAASGYLGLTNYGYWPGQDDVPSPATPNNVIAPYWTPIYLNSSGPQGRVYYKSGGTTPNRYFVVEWFDVKGGNPSDTTGRDDTYRFEVVLYENGNILFQYQTMTVTGDWWCGASGIEDSSGLVGLSYIGFCGLPSSNTAVRFTRPAPSARVSLNPTANGAFGMPGTTVQMNETIRNTGDVGVDTYDLFWASLWPVALFHADGVTPLTDTDSDGAIDTGPIAQSASTTIVARFTVPANTTLGQFANNQLTARSSLNTGKSKIVPMQVAVPAMFAQSYTQNYSPYTGFYRPTGQATRRTTTDSGYYPAVATTPDGNIVQVWYELRTNSYGKYVSELYYAMFDRYGNIIRAPSRVTDNSSATLNTYDYNPAVAVAPNGNIGFVWYRYGYNSSNSTYNFNVNFMILNSAGGFVTVRSLSNNAQWGAWNSSVPRFYEPTIAALTNNRFVMAWRRSQYTSSTYQYTLWYAVSDTSGAQIRAATQFGSSTRSYYPNLTPLADGTVFISHYADGSIGYGRLDSSGNVLNAFTPLSTYGYYPDAAQLPNGNIVLAWESWNGTRYILQYAVLNSSLGTVKGVTALPSISPVGDQSPSVTYFGNRAVITWGDDCCEYYPNLYYTLLDGVGSLLTPPMVFASDNSYYSMQLQYNGQGNTYLPEANDTTPPTSQANSPAFATEPFIVTWSGSDTGSGIMNYDVQVRDGAGGAWTTWLPNTVETSAVFGTGVVGHTYYFRSVARDWIGNVETAPANGDTSTTVAAYKVVGSVFNNRHQPVFNASVEADPSALNTAKSGSVGDYVLFLNTTGVYSATASRYGFGPLPPQRNLSFSGNTTLSDFVLPPVNNAVTNGGWETGDFTGWTVEPSVTITAEMAAAHTGLYGLRLDANSAITTVVPSISQMVTVTGTQPALSWLYRVTQGSDEDFLVTITGDSHVVSETLTLTPGKWSHGWLDLESFAGQAVTITFGFQDQSTSQQLYLDEVSVGGTQRGVYSIYLPLVLR